MGLAEELPVYKRSYDLSCSSSIPENLDSDNFYRNSVLEKNPWMEKLCHPFRVGW